MYTDPITCHVLWDTITTQRERIGLKGTGLSEQRRWDNKQREIEASRPDNVTMVHFFWSKVI